MPYTPPTQQQLQARANSNIQSRMPGTTPTLRRGIVPAFAYAMWKGIVALYGYMAALFAQAVPLTATGTYLENWAALWGVERPQPTAASGIIQIVATADADLLAATVLQNAATGLSYVTGAFLAIGGAGVVNITVTCTTPGSAGNLAAGQTLTFVNPPATIQVNATVGMGGITGGTDLGTDEQLLAALQNRIQLPPHGGSQNDYVVWAQANAITGAGITRAWCFPLYSGVGTVKVYVVDDNYPGPGLASAAEVTAVQAYINSVRPADATIIVGGAQQSGVTVAAPTAHAVNFTISGGFSAGQQAAVQAALASYFMRNAVPEAGVPLNALLVTIAEAAGTSSFAMTAPGAAPVAAAGQILVPGTYAFS